jgi:hypothetical protein
MDCNNVFQVVDTDGTYSLLKSNMVIPQSESWSSCLTTPSHGSLTQAYAQHNETCSLYKSNLMGMSACNTYKSSCHLSSCKSDVSANSEEIVTRFSAPMEICQDDNFTPISESHSDLRAGFCPGCKIQRLDSLPDVGRTSSDISVSSVDAQTSDSPLPRTNVVIEHRATCSVPHFCQDLIGYETGELNLCSQDQATHSAHPSSDMSVTSKTPEKKFKTVVPRQLRFSFSRNTHSRRFYCKLSSSSSNQDSVCAAEFTPLSPADISQPQSQVFLPDQILMKSCGKQLDTKEEQSVTTLVFATTNTFLLSVVNFTNTNHTYFSFV